MFTPARDTSENDALSFNMTIILVFIVHSLVNTLLITPWNPLRCSYWRLAECSSDQDWMLNWLALAHFHVCILISCLAVKARGNFLLEQRLVFLCAMIMVTLLSNGIFMLDELSQPMAALQAIIYVVILFSIAYKEATASPVAAVLFPSQVLRSSSFDRRRKLAIPTAAAFIQFCLASIRLIDMTFGQGRDG